MRTLGRVADGEEYIVRHQHAAMGGVPGCPDGLPLEAQGGEDGGRRDVRGGGIGHDAVVSELWLGNKQRSEHLRVRDMFITLVVIHMGERDGHGSGSEHGGLPHHAGSQRQFHDD